MTGCWANATPLAAEAEGWMVIASCVAAPGVRAIVFDVAPVSDGTLKPSVKLPGVPVIESPANVATPRALVTTLVAPPSTPPTPEAITAVTVKPATLTALPAASRTWSTGCSANATPLAAVAEGCVLIVTCVAVPGAKARTLEMTLVYPAELKISVWFPMAPVIAKSVKIATPLALVVAVGPPPSVPAPLAIAAVTTTPAWLTAFPTASRSWTCGCCANTIPLAGAAEGCVVSVSCGVPDAVTVTALDVAPMSTPELKFRVRPPAVPVMARLKKVATPLALVVAVTVPPSVPPPMASEAVTTVPNWLTALPAASRS